MNKKAELIYRKSPIFFQNLLVSIYGYKINRTRHGNNFESFLKVINKRVQYSVDELKKFQLESLQKLFQLCITHVPYYKKKFRAFGLQPHDIKSLTDIEMIPLLEKDEIRKYPEYFINDQYKKEKLIKIHTTGTTGTPLNIYCTNNVRQKNYAFYNRFLKLANLDYKKKRATFGGRIIIPEKQAAPSFWRYSFFQKNLLFSSYHLRDSTINSYIDKLFEFQPHYIDAYPSSIYTIAKYAYENNIDLKGITKGITTSAETLFDEQRSMIENVFKVPLIDQYGAAEMCVFVGQCNCGNYHIHSDFGLLEFLNEDGTQAKPGVTAELVCSSFINPVMPLLRYRIGDFGILSDRTCKCGSPFPVVDKIIGRIDDTIRTPEGNRIGRLSPVLKGFPVKEAQYVQNNINTIVVRLITDDGYNLNIENEIEVELRKRLGGTIEIQIEKVKSIDRGAGGKLKSIVSNLK